VNGLSLRAVADRAKELAERARHRELSVDEVGSGTFTVTNLGMFGVEAFTPIINPPQTAILGIGRVMEKPRVVGGQIKSTPVVCLSLTFDHRVVDGADAARFLDTFVHLLSDLSWLQS
jgi:pyruvate dehydrogenase E2 component (dihydrolipoamide acetyltransferase)